MTTDDLKPRTAGKILAFIMLRLAWLELARKPPRQESAPVDAFVRATRAEIRLTDLEKFTRAEYDLVFEVCK